LPEVVAGMGGKKDKPLTAAGAAAAAARLAPSGEASVAWHALPVAEVLR
jgi:hypothetical protein